MSRRESWYVYVAECADGSLYTGIAKDVDARIELHNEGKGAKYTRGRTPLRAVRRSRPLAKGKALSLEAHVKRLRGEAKLRAIDGFIAPRKRRAKG
jgi:putative endonuclease